MGKPRPPCSGSQQSHLLPAYSWLKLLFGWRTFEKEKTFNQQKAEKPGGDGQQQNSSGIWAINETVEIGTCEVIIDSTLLRIGGLFDAQTLW